MYIICLIAVLSRGTIFAGSSSGVPRRGENRSGRGVREEQEDPRLISSLSW